jgi:hypothetical protein
MLGTYPIVHCSERLALAKAYIALTRVMGGSVFGKKPADHSLLRPMNATKISHYIGLPRSTVIRKLNEFLRTGVIARHGNVYLLKRSAIRPTQIVTVGHGSSNVDLHTTLTAQGCPLVRVCPVAQFGVQSVRGPASARPSDPGLTKIQARRRAEPGCT